ncbi:MAG: FAD-dependent oxidoreductase [Actinobacteria bacterium]|nr:FAD-dependent oxidoreductase [Actinomycetota bacterium]
MDAIVCWEDEIEIRLPDGGPGSILGMSPVHKPVQTIRGVVANNDLLRPLEKLALGRFFAAVILTPPEPFLAMAPEEVLAVVVRDARHLGLDLEGHVTDFRVIAHPHGFHSLEPGHLGLRPDQATPVPGLGLAGDYTRHRFMASMEGAVVSGTRAAELACTAIGNQGGGSPCVS